MPQVQGVLGDDEACFEKPIEVAGSGPAHLAWDSVKSLARLVFITGVAYLLTYKAPSCRWYGGEDEGVLAVLSAPFVFAK